MLSESMCDRCMSPGACCKSLRLNGGGARRGSDDEQRVNNIGEPMSMERAEHLALSKGLWMFRPLAQEEDGTWRWWCTALEANGRCSIYADRPDLCRRYLPGEDGLCVHHWPDPKRLDPEDQAATTQQSEGG